MALVKATPERAIAVAMAEVGYLEKKSNSQLDSKTANAGYKNYTKYARDLDAITDFYNGRKQSAAWCDLFVDWVMIEAFGRKAGQKLLCQPNKSCGAGCSFSADYYKAKGQFHKSNPKPGDQIFFLDSSGDVCHTGLVYKVDNLYVHTIEGNTSSQAGVVANGGGVFKKSYAINYSRIYGYGRPDYANVYYDDTVVIIIPEEITTGKLNVDGAWGMATTKRLQQIFGTTVDGIVSNQYACYEDSNPGLASGWEWEKNPGKNGSQLIKKMQKWAGMPVSKQDGFIGPNTIKALQKKLGTWPDGKVSRESAMVKALQRWANKQ